MARKFIFTKDSLIPSQTVTHSLYNLATYPEYVEPLREENGNPGTGLEQSFRCRDDQTGQLCQRNDAIIANRGMYVFNPVFPSTLRTI
jgi:hypothetical protein